MKKIVKIAVMPLLAVAMLGFTGFPLEGKQDKGHGQQGHSGGNDNKGGKDNRQQSGGSSHGNGGGKDQSNGGHSQGHKDNSQSQGNGNGGGKDRSDERSQGKGNVSKGNSGKQDHGNQENSGNAQHGNKDNRNHGNSVSGKAEHGNMHGNQGNVTKNRNTHGKHHQERIEGWNDNVDWGFDRYTERRRPGNGKKVTICHRTSGEYPVTINVSEHAVQAHMNHGDNMGGCNVNYSDRWTPNYIEARQSVYNTYEQTWETMSYSEALLRYAAEKLLGIRSNLTLYRPTLSNQEIQRREALIYELQNNINALEAQRSLTSQRLSGININIDL
ncbi:MAG: hypothetical protein K0S09_1031 [Sphingobacteriaceae bacterium]|jgi:hypothetical protein|nr:hypothetical protein [Sphingobacteriaceae bacterium]